MRFFALLLFAALAGVPGDQPSVFVADHPRTCPHCQAHAASPQQIHTLAKACPELRITGSIEEAEFLVVWDSKTWNETSWGGRQQEYVIYNQAGDVIASGDAHRISAAAKDICQKLLKAAKPKEGN